MSGIVKQKYPRTLHLPWSAGITNDDRVLTSVEHFIGQEVVVTEKMDGENTTIYHDGSMHARSIDSKDHRIKALAATLAPYLYTDEISALGENMVATHYNALPGYFMLFGVRYTDSYAPTMIDWAYVKGLSNQSGVPTVPILYQGIWDEQAIRACMTGRSKCGGEQEGYVVRLKRQFHMHEWDTSIAKFVRSPVSIP